MCVRGGVGVYSHAHFCACVHLQKIATGLNSLGKGNRRSPAELRIKGKKATWAEVSSCHVGCEKDIVCISSSLQHFLHQPPPCFLQPLGPGCPESSSLDKRPWGPSHSRSPSPAPPLWSCAHCPTCVVVRCEQMRECLSARPAGLGAPKTRDCVYFLHHCTSAPSRMPGTRQPTC